MFLHYPSCCKFLLSCADLSARPCEGYRILKKSERLGLQYWSMHLIKSTDDMSINADSDGLRSYKEGWIQSSYES